MSLPRPPSHRPDYAALLCPPLALSAAAEALAASLAAGAGTLEPRPFAAGLAGACLFAAGAVFGQHFDSAAARRERPERQPAEGLEPLPGAWRLGWALLLTGALLGGLGGRNAALAGVGVALLVVLYAAVTKNVWGAGFLTFGAMRGANFLMGLCFSDVGPGRYLPALVPVLLYSVGWALFRGSRRPHAPPTTAFVGLLHLVAGLSVLLYQALGQFGYPGPSLPFLLGTLGLTLPRFVNATLDPRPAWVTQAVLYGFLGFPLLHATLAAGHAGLSAGVLVTLVGIGVYSALRRWPVTPSTPFP